MIYLDNATACRPSAKVVQAMEPYHRDRWGNPASPHDLGQDLWPGIERDLDALYEYFGAAETDTVLLTSSGAEAVNHVLMGTYYEVTRETGQNHFLTSSVDEAPVIMGIGRLEQLGCVGKMLEVGSKGYISGADVADAITPRTALVSLSWANALTGVLNPVMEIAEVCKERGILFHLEASQVMGRLDFDLSEVGADFISFHGENIHGPKGTGALWIRSGVPLPSLILGGSDQGGHRAGHLNTPGLAGLAQAARESLESMDHVAMEVARLRNEFESALTERISGCQVHFRDEERVPTTTVMSFPEVANEALLYRLNRAGLYACMGGGHLQQLALVLEAAGIDESIAQSAISFSFSRETTEEEVEEAVELVVKSVELLRKVSHSCFHALEEA